MRFHISRQQQQILKDILVLGGVITVGLVAPNAVQLLKPFVKTKRKPITFSFYGHRMLASLERQGFVNMDAETITLTTKGFGYTQILVSVETYTPPTEWDGKWRMVCFDIPETHRVARKFLRDNLDRIGFAHLQKSVYFYPHDCLEVVNQMVSHFRIAKYVTFGVLELLEGDNLLRKRFGLI